MSSVGKMPIAILQKDENELINYGMADVNSRPLRDVGRITPEQREGNSMGMSARKVLAGCFAIVICSNPGFSQSFLSRPIQLTVPFPAGSATDIVARFVGDKLSEELKQPVVIENRGGANGILAAQTFIRHTPDGYNIFIASNTTHAANLSLYN